MFHLESILIASGYLGIFGLMIPNGFIGFPSSQFLYIFTGYFVSTGTLHVFWASLVGAIGNTIGNVILYELTRFRGIEYITTYKMFPLREVRKVQVAFQRRGALFLFVGKLLPAVKVWAPIPAGLSKMNRALYITVIFTASWVWAIIFIGIGMIFGKSTEFLGRYSLILLAVAFLVVFVFYRYMNSASIRAEAEEK